MPQPLTINAMRLQPFVLAPNVVSTLMVTPIAPIAVQHEPMEVMATAVTTAALNRFSPAMLEIRANPGLSQLIGSTLPPPPPGFERSATTRPIAEAVTVTETTVFVSADGAGTWYLPHYSLRTLSAARYDIAVTTTQGGFRISAGVDGKVPNGMSLAAGAEELPHTVEVWMTYTDGKGLLQNLVFLELLHDDAQRLTGFAAPLTLSQRDNVVRSVHQGSARLMLRRMVQVAAQSVDAAGGGVVMDQRFKMMSWSAVKKTELPVRSLRSRVHLDAAVHRDLQFDVTSLLPLPELPPAAAPMRYHDVDQTFEQALDPDPLLLDEHLHAYFAAGAGGLATGTTQALRRISVSWFDGATTRQHPYFQDSDDPALFYYLPDTYRLGRTAHPPFVPEMEVRMTAPGATTSAVISTIDYIARPKTNPARLEAARTQLASEVPATSRATGALPRLVVMPAKATLRMSVPGAAGVALQEFPAVTIDIANGFRQALTVTLADFRQLFAAAFSDDATSLFVGEVLVDTRLPSPESVPVDIRFAHTVGPLLDSIETPGIGNAVAVKLRNYTESTLRITALPLHMVRGAAIVSGRADGLDLTAPVEMPPGGTLEFTAIPQAPLDGSGAVDVVFDLDQVAVLAKPEQILPVISDTSVPASYLREIKVMALPAAFSGQPAATPAVPPVALIHVEFETGDSVDLTLDAANAVAHIRLPLVNLLLNQDVRASYRFRQHVVYQTGDQAEDADWRQSSSDLLVVPMKSTS